MSLSMKKLSRIVILIIGAAAFTLLGFYSHKINLDRWKPKPLIEQIPFEEVLEVLGFEEEEFYTSTNEFMRAEIKIKVKFPSHIEPADRLPSEYKNGQKKAYTTAEILVTDVPSAEMLTKMKEALSQRKYLKIAKDQEMKVVFKETRIDHKKVKSIERISLKPGSYYFVQF
jgi:hypothetical protein